MTRTTIVPYFILPTSQQKVKKKRPRAHDSQTLCRSIQYVKKKNQTEAWFSVLALPIFMGSDASAACGRYSELSEWQRSARCKPTSSGAANRNRWTHRFPSLWVKKKPPLESGGFCVRVTYFHGERCERCLRQIQRAERVAAVEIS